MNSFGKECAEMFMDAYEAAYERTQNNEKAQMTAGAVLMVYMQTHKEDPVERMIQNAMANTYSMIYESKKKNGGKKNGKTKPSNDEGNDC